MHNSKKYLSIVSASLMHGLLLASPDINGPLVQRDESGQICINPLMSSDLVDDLHQLIKRSYRITNRGDNEHDFLHPNRLIKNRSNRMSHSSLSSDGLRRETFTNTWFLHKPFIGMHGATSLGGIAGLLIPGSMESDFQGFVAYLAPERGRPPVVAIIYRGSQSKSFQKLNGILGPSWLTNFSAQKMKFPTSSGELEGYPQIENIENTVFHKGFLAKYLSGRYSVLADIENVWSTIPENLRSKTRFIITGHSQGAGIAIPAALDIVNTLGKRFFGETFNNIETPRFFVYALSGPNPVGDVYTKNIMHAIIGRDNIIRHNSIFDIVTYACLGERYNKWIYNTIFGAVAGVETGYHPVGHLAIDDVKQLFAKGLKYNKREDMLANVDKLWSTWAKFYSEAIRKRQTDSYLECFYRAIKVCCIGAKGIKEMDGIYFFVCVNHYGSITANVECLPIENAKKKRLIRSMTYVNHGEETQQAIQPYAVVIDNEDHGASFDPRLPEYDLTACLIRGENHRNLIKKLCLLESVEQVFDPALVEDAAVILAGYESDEEEA